MASTPPNDVDKYVGMLIRKRRIMLGLSQQQLADMIGVTYQQEHKYESALNRVSASRLYAIAEALDVPVGYFFRGFAKRKASDDTPTSSRHRMAIDLARNFSLISDRKQREAVAYMVRALVP